MDPLNRKALISILVVLIIGALLAWAGSQGGQFVYGIPLFALLVGMAFIIQWIVFIPAFIFQSEKFFDLTGSLTYILVIITGLVLSNSQDSRSILLLAMVVIWAVRLGGFLFLRIHRAGKDDRFDEWKPSFFRYLNVWNLQGLWVSFTMASATIAISSSNSRELDIFALIGGVVWLIGLVIEATADGQKRRFKSDPANDGKFIQSGLWSRSRHPNYFGEIILWVGVAIVVIPVLQGWQWIALISPVFVTLLLTRVSGIPILEDKAEKSWGGQADYEKYKKSTPTLIPKI